MQTTVTIRDATTLGLASPELVFVVSVPTEHITVRELIRARVQQEVDEHNSRQPEYFRGLVQPSGAEATLNGFRLPKRRQIDWKQQFEKAIEAFQRNGFIVLVDDRQVAELDEFIEITSDTSVTFLKLVPLVGG